MPGIYFLNETIIKNPQPSNSALNTIGVATSTNDGILINCSDSGLYRLNKALATYNADGNYVIAASTAASGCWLKSVNNAVLKYKKYYPLGAPRILNLASYDAQLKGFRGGFTDGRYGYFVPRTYSKVARVDLQNFSSVAVLNLASYDVQLKGFQGGFTDGRYGYFVPFHNGSYFGKVARIDLVNFSTVTVLNLASYDVGLKGFSGGFTDGRYGYFVPLLNDGGYSSKVARVDLQNFSTVTVLNLASYDVELKGFQSGFTDGKYGYFAPYQISATTYIGKVARVKLQDFSTVTVLNLASYDVELKGFYGGFIDGKYGYFVPNYNGSSFSGKVTKVDLQDFSTVTVLNLASYDVRLQGFTGGFTDGRYSYFAPWSNGGSHFGKVPRVDLLNFSTVEVLNLASYDAELVGFQGCFTDGKYGYFVPFENDSNNMGKVARLQMFFGGNF